MNKLKDIIRSNLLLLKYKYKAFRFKHENNSQKIDISKVIEESKDDRIRVWKRLVEQAWETEALENRIKKLENKIKVKAKVKKK